MKNYFVLYGRDTKTEKREEYNSNRMLFDSIKKFSHLVEAAEFVQGKPLALLCTRLPLNKINPTKLKNEKTPYIAVARFHGKFTHTDYTGDTDYLKTYDTVKCAEEELQDILEKFSLEEHFEKTYVGIELKLFSPNQVEEAFSKIEEILLN